MTHPEAPAGKAPEYIRTFPAQPDEGEDLRAWVHQIYLYVEEEARDAVDWYTRNSKSKKAGALTFRYLALVFGSLAGLLPIIFAVLPPGIRALSPVAAEQAALFVSLLIGIVALLIGIDRFGDFSSGWIRYMLTAFNIRRELQEFRLDWASQFAELPRPLTYKDVPGAIERAKAFVLKIEGYVGDETRQWATEFQQNLRQMETEITKRWEEREKEVGRHAAAAAASGAIEVTVTNAQQVEDRTFVVGIEPGNIEEEVVGARAWVKAGLAPGMHTVTARGRIDGEPAADSRAVTIRPNEVAAVELTLFAPKARAAAP